MMLQMRRIWINLRHLSPYQRRTLFKIGTGIILSSVLLSFFVLLLFQMKPNQPQIPTITTQQSSTYKEKPTHEVNYPKTQETRNELIEEMENNPGEFDDHLSQQVENHLNELDKKKHIDNQHEQPTSPEKPPKSIVSDQSNTPIEESPKVVKSNNKKKQEKSGKSFNKKLRRRTRKKPSQVNNQKMLMKKSMQWLTQSVVPEHLKDRQNRESIVQDAILKGLEYIHSVSSHNEDIFVDESQDILSTFVNLLYTKSSNPEIYRKATSYTAELLEEHVSYLRVALRHRIEEVMNDQDSTDPEHVKNLLEILRSLLNYQILNIPHKNSRKKIGEMIDALQQVQDRNQLYKNVWKFDINDPSVTEHFIQELPELLIKVNKEPKLIKRFTETIQSLGEFYERLGEFFMDAYALERTRFSLPGIYIHDILKKWLPAIRPLYKITPLTVQMKKVKHKIRLSGVLKDTYHALIHLVVRIVNIVTGE